MILNLAATSKDVQFAFNLSGCASFYYKITPFSSFVGSVRIHLQSIGHLVSGKYQLYHDVYFIGKRFSYFNLLKYH